MVIEISLVFFKRHFVSSFMFSIIISFLLNCIICQMNKFIAYLLEWILTRACTNVALIIKVPLEMSIDWSQHSIASNVKFSLFIQSRLFQILLDNKCPLMIVLWCVKYWLYLIKSRADINAMTSISVLTWLHNPYISLFLLKRLI